MTGLRGVALLVAIATLLVGLEGCFYKAGTRPGEPGYRPYYEGVAVGSPWYGFPYGPPGWYPSEVHLGGARLGGRY